ncbi:TetR family transcriptional regulator [Epidermidibacterium keratini]|uniref:TetR family transcriptional regulator n=1 Tax=Epidermidibacterium keratini TaxID=1891644 RepID=A0A7L4YN23_9ACTN|nr:TetR/AcrR family transcriptional regulator [Epidermidibacterium keratini]QHC00219.1 TetR family transcriptional regulator [Epidermidibacterium keratini]
MSTVPIAAPRGTRRNDKRTAILNAAAEVFAEVGYERASIDAISSRAGVSKPTVYSHFGGKEQLFRESIALSAEIVNAESLDAIRALDPQCRDWQGGLLALAEQLVTCQRSDCAVSLSRQIHAEVGRDPEVLRYVRERTTDPIIDGLAGRLAMLGNAGRIAVPDPVLAAKQFIALISAEFPDLTELGTKKITDKRARAAVRAGLDTFLRAYAAP